MSNKPRDVEQALEWACLRDVALAEGQGLSIGESGDYVEGVNALREAWDSAEHSADLEGEAARATSGLRLACRKLARERSEFWADQSGEPALAEQDEELDQAAADVMREVMLEVDGEKEGDADGQTPG